MRIPDSDLGSRLFCRRGFQEIQFLGNGLIGSATLSREINTGQEVVIKTITSATSPKMEELFMNDFAIIANSNHPNILPFLGLITSSHHGRNPPATVSVYMPNGSLDKIFDTYINNHNQTQNVWLGNLKFLENRLKILIGIIHGMLYLHDVKHIAHLNLKPNNVLVDDEYTTFLSDFGLSQLIDRTHAANVGLEGDLIYLSPEILRGEAADYKADVYSFSMILFEMITGIRPFREITNKKLLIKSIVNGKRPEISNTVPSSLAKLLKQCWQNNKENRPSFSEILEELKTCDFMQRETNENQNIRNFINEYSDSIIQLAKNYKRKEESGWSSIFGKIISCKGFINSIWFLIRIMQCYGLTFSNPVDSFMSNANPVFSWFQRFSDKLFSFLFGVEDFTNVQNLIMSSCPLSLILFFTSFGNRRQPFGSQNGIITNLSSFFLLPLGLLLGIICYNNCPFNKWWIYMIFSIHLLIVLTYFCLSRIFHFSRRHFQDEYEKNILLLLFLFGFPTTFYLDLDKFVCLDMKINYFVENIVISVLATLFTALIIIFMTDNIGLGILVAILCILLFLLYIIVRSSTHFGIDRKSIDKSFVSTARKIYLILQTVFYIPASEFIFRCIRENLNPNGIYHSYKKGFHNIELPIVIYSLLFSVLITILFLMYFSYRAISYRNKLNPYCFRFIMNNSSTFLGFNCSDLKMWYLWFEPVDSISRFIFAGFTVYNLNWFALALNAIEGLFIIIFRPYVFPSDNILTAGEMIILSIANGFSAAEISGTVFRHWYAYFLIIIAFVPLIISLFVFFIFEWRKEEKFMNEDINRLLTSRKSLKPKTSTNAEINKFGVEQFDYYYYNHDDDLGLDYRGGSRLISLVEDDPRFHRFYSIVFQKSYLVFGLPLLLVFLFWYNMDHILY